MVQTFNLKDLTYHIGNSCVLFCLLKDEREFFGFPDQKLQSNVQTTPKSSPEIKFLNFLSYPLPPEVTGSDSKRTFLTSIEREMYLNHQKNDQKLTGNSYKMAIFE